MTQATLAASDSIVVGRSARMRASTASIEVAPAERASTSSAASSARGATGMPFSSSVRNSHDASAARAMLHDGLVIAEVSCSRLPASCAMRRSCALKC